jgi:pimeloyl-ACP methyl ester carboxylesterase
VTPAELRALGEVAARAFTGLVEQVESVHEAVADRTPQVPVVAPVQRETARAVYSIVGAVGDAALRIAGRAAALVAADDTTVHDRRFGAAAVGALNGAFGDRFAPTDGPLAVPMTLRHDGRDLAIEPQALRRAFPLASGRVVVLVHGLGMTDDGWTSDDPRHVTYAEVLRRELGCAVLTVRYNTGRRIAANGVELASLLERLSAAWPDGIHDLSLIGHSMGGLVCRSAATVGVESHHGWVDELDHVVLLGSPLLGASLERAAATAASLLDRLPESRFVGTLLNLRSDGVLDLRDGTLTDDHHPPRNDPWPWGERGDAAPLVPGVRHHVVAATLSRNPEAWWAAKLVGDLLVTPGSASSAARGARRLSFAADDAVTLGGLSHFDLLHHPQVARHLRRWLRPRGALPAAGGTGDGRVDGTSHDA